MSIPSAKGSGKAPIRYPDRFFIGGEWVVPSSDARFDVITPSTEEIYASVAEAQAVDMDRAVAAARQAFDSGPWPRMSHGERARYIAAIGKMVAEHSGDIARIWTSEMGAISPVAEALVSGVAGAYQYYAGLAATFPFEERHVPQAGGDVGLLVREPVGVVAAIVPWNAPPLLIAYKLAPALLAGCTVVLKASPEAPVSAYAVAEMVEAVGVPAGVVNVVTADRAVSELLVRNSAVDKVTFTGSSAAGKRIASICGERVARCTLELGGKSAAVVFDDYDISAVAEALSGSVRLMTGQVCSSLTRVVVSERRHDELVDALSAAFKQIRIGDPFSPNTDMGPLAMGRQRDRVEHYIAKGKAEGAVLVSGGGRPRDLNRGFFIEPTIFGWVDNHSTIAREEIFGPVVSVIASKDEAQSIDIANDSVFGLNASIFTNDIDRAYRAARQLQAGTVGHNAFRGDFSIAFGGFKQSGIGREGGVEGLLPFLEAKTVILDGEPSHLRP